MVDNVATVSDTLLECQLWFPIVGRSPVGERPVGEQPESEQPVGGQSAGQSGSGGAASTLGSAMRRALMGYRRRMDRELDALGFPERRFPEGRVLRMCAAAAGTTISDVGRALGITRQGASKIVAGLRERGYVEVMPSPADGREKILALTPRATAYLAALHEARHAVEVRLREDIGADEVKRVIDVLAVVAGDEDGQRPDVLADAPVIRALRLWDAEESP
jgi:DNA-binding MarR family transcriptional regulator